MVNRISIGASACLLGEKVRYDGGDKLDHFLTGTLGTFFTFVPVCPETGCGLPVPREVMRLEEEPQSPRLFTIRGRVDLTERMIAYCRRTVTNLEQEELCGFIFKKNSPSCGLFRVNVYNRGISAKSGRGLFAAAMAGHFPLLPVEEEGRLYDMTIRENFIERVFAYRRWNEFLRGRKGMGELAAFHEVNRLQLMAHSPRLYREMEKLLATGKSMKREELLTRYGKCFMEALSFHATMKKNTDVLMHIMGYFKKQLSHAEKAELLELIRQYHARLIPLIVPVTLLGHHISRLGLEYLLEQTYLKPHPMEFMLRNLNS
jgi:uncharacterized protein YbgA (DUF1722 family)/uncharacterized protein YbbK (DUF523 family)